MKRCTQCGETKPLDAFVRRSNRRNGSSHCRTCRNKLDRARERASTPSAEKVAGMMSWGTAIQQAAAESLLSFGSIEAAAENMKMSASRLRAHLQELERAAARSGWSPGSDMTKTQPPGFRVKGVSSYYNAGGELTGQWVKTSADPDDRYSLLLAAVAEIAEPFRGMSDPVAAPATVDRDLLNVIPMGDPHLGMLSWAPETGDDFDLQIAERDLVGAVDHLVALAPPAEECLIINLGDFFHTDSNQNRTARAGNTLDVDSRWAKILSVGVRTMRRCIDRALERHTRVRVICEIGNHDDHSSVMLAICLANFYERDPRVVVDTSPAKFHWHRFGANLIGVTHGDTVKAQDLPGIMACDKAEDWGETRHRFWYTGHVHHDTLKEYRGVTVETFRTLAARDAWHHGQGYRSGRDLKLDVLHREHGRICRHSVGIPQIQKAEP